ncbi:hypothetical protein V6N12_031633 [Hibiscus sabdariffa]|uniref:Integrase catalytic domain-containing protein n=1 Tax=Hibiscus sabdariffa TaxID=183260 RepID=A0ABR2DV28_9ROSI
MTKAPFSGKGERASDLLGLIHSDVCGPMNTQARGGFQYFITFTDDFSRYGYIYLMCHKSEALERFKEFKNEVQNQHGKSIKALRSDRGGEYLSQDFDELLKECGIVSQLTPPGTPQWNGVSESRNRTLLDMVRSMMSHSDLPISFWGHALETAAFTLNRVPSKSVQKTPYEIWTGKRPSMSFMKIWGCQAYVKYQMSTKLEPRSHKCIFVGYPKETKGYYFFNPKENKVFVARTGVFLEKEFLSSKRLFGKEFPSSCSLVYSGGLSRDLDEIFVEIQDPSKWFHQENKSCDFLRVFLLGAFSPGFKERRSSFRDLTI